MLKYIPGTSIKDGILKHFKRYFKTRTGYVKIFQEYFQTFKQYSLEIKVYDSENISGKFYKYLVIGMRLIFK